MAYRKRRIVIGRSGRRRVYARRHRSPKQGSRYGSGFLGRIFNTNWLFGRSRTRTTNGKRLGITGAGTGTGTTSILTPVSSSTHAGGVTGTTAHPGSTGTAPLPKRGDR